MTYRIKIDRFEGPLDLLLHLIDKAELNIYEIDISQITDQYLEYLDIMKELDLEITSEFIVLASTLLLIKSKSLLPGNSMDKSEDEEYFDKELLIQRLIEYKRFKRAAEELHDMQKNHNDIFNRELKHDSPGLMKSKPVLVGLNVEELFDAFRMVLKANVTTNEQVEERKIVKSIVTIKQRMDYILDVLFKKGNLRFKELFPEIYSNQQKVVSFLAILELLKLNRIIVEQKDLFDDIYIYGKND